MPADLAEVAFPAMGGTAHVLVVGDATLLRRARDRIIQLEQRWSRFLPTSEVQRLNDAAGRALRVSSDTVALVQRAVDGWRATGGLFDPTVLGDVVRAGYDRTFTAVVSGAARGVSLLTRDAGGIVVDATAATVQLPAGTGFDPGGIGKGLAADLVVEELLAAGARGACVNLGGDVRVAGEGPDRGRWVVAVEHPDRARPLHLLALVDGAVATSSCLRRAWTVDGEPRHHVIDPRSGVAARSGVTSVTAVASGAGEAEVAAKAALLAGPDGALATLAALGCEGVITTSGDPARATPGLAAFVVTPRPGAVGT